MQQANANHPSIRVVSGTHSVCRSGVTTLEKDERTHVVISSSGLLALLLPLELSHLCVGAWLDQILVELPGGAAI